MVENKWAPWGYNRDNPYKVELWGPSYNWCLGPLWYHFKIFRTSKVMTCYNPRGPLWEKATKMFVLWHLFSLVSRPKQTVRGLAPSKNWRWKRGEGGRVSGFYLSQPVVGPLGIHTWWLVMICREHEAWHKRQKTAQTKKKRFWHVDSCDKL